MLDETLGKFHFWVTFLGAYAIFFPMHYIGLLGVPRRYHEIGDTSFIPASAHDPERLHQRSRRFIVGFAQMVFLFNLIWSLFHGKAGGGKPVARDDARMADAGDAARRMAIWARSCRSSTAGPTITACPAPRRTSSRRTSRRPPRAG